MSLVRSLTSLRNKIAVDHSDGQPSKSLLRGRISSPLALISTSNVALNNARHIAGANEIVIPSASPTSPGSMHSTDDSDATINSSFSVDQHSTDASSVDESPLADNHLSCYFKPAVDSMTKVAHRSRSQSVLSTTADAPILPSRQPSHSKRAHESVHRQRSIRRLMSPPPDTARAMLSTRHSATDLRSSAVDLAHEPFGRELAQLDVVAEELGQVVRDAEACQDLVVMEAHGLAYFNAGDYLSEIQELLDTTYGVSSSICSSWI